MYKCDFLSLAFLHDPKHDNLLKKTAFTAQGFPKLFDLSSLFCGDNPMYLVEVVARKPGRGSKSKAFFFFFKEEKNHKIGKISWHSYLG